MNSKLLQLRAVRRDYSSEAGQLSVLKDIDLDICAGEYVAIVGASGCGKSTLMHILGCLDRPTKGSYYIAGRNTASMTSNELAALRREQFGFIFQRYSLIPELTAIANVELPAIYSGKSRKDRESRATALLNRFMLGDRLTYRPAQLSGGQQQRVSIARALMNNAAIILADEPTGALDSRAGASVLRSLAALHADGHTVVVVTHDEDVAGQADRIVALSDGEITTRHAKRSTYLRVGINAKWLSKSNPTNSLVARSTRYLEVVRAGLRAIASHRLRTSLTMLGVIIGISSVVSVVALGNGTEERVRRSISELGTNTLDIYPGDGLGDMHASRLQTLRTADALALASQSFVDSATPRVTTSAMVRYKAFGATAQVVGVGVEFFRVKGIGMLEGATFNTESIGKMDQSAVIDENTERTLFGSSQGSPIGKIILLGALPVRVIGVVKRPDDLVISNNLSIWLPYTTVMIRLLGQAYLSGITVRIPDGTPMSVAEGAVTRLLSVRHRRKDFFVQNSAKIRETIESTTRAMALLVGSIAAVTLFVGGIGVMNITLVSVTERTREIGIRMAVGGRQKDILQQFLIEATLVCLIGGTLGVLTALGIGAFCNANGAQLMIFRSNSIIAAVLSSVLVGVTFGLAPAFRAARLPPIEALASE